jgi:hypothetical protein
LASGAAFCTNSMNRLTHRRRQRHPRLRSRRRMRWSVGQLHGRREREPLVAVGAGHERGGRARPRRPSSRSSCPRSRFASGFGSTPAAFKARPAALPHHSSSGAPHPRSCSRRRRRP